MVLGSNVMVPVSNIVVPGSSVMVSIDNVNDIINLHIKKIIVTVPQIWMLIFFRSKTNFRK